MIKIIKQSSEISLKNGDIVPFSDKKYLKKQPVLSKEMNLVSLEYFNDNVFEALKELDIDFSDATQKYRCPHSKMEFYSLVPMYLYTHDLSQYVDFNEDDVFSRMMFDKDWNYKEEIHPSQIHKAMLGSGYTGCTNRNDGCNSYLITSIELENGDEIICLTYEWFNK